MRPISRSRFGKARKYALQRVGRESAQVREWGLGEAAAQYSLAVRRFSYAAAVAVAAAGGGIATRRSVATWYPGLRKPSWTPPPWAFGPAWTVVYAQMAYSAHRVARSSDPKRRPALGLWWLQLGLNAAWSPIFFGARRPGAGAAVVCTLVPTVAATAAATARVDRAAGLLYAPYLAWSTYAAALNLSIWRSNHS